MKSRICIPCVLLALTTFRAVAVRASERAAPDLAPATAPASQPAPTTQAVDPWTDQSTPKQTLLASHLVFLVPNGPPLADLFYADDEAGRKMLDALSEASAANALLVAAINKRFGKEGIERLRLQRVPADEVIQGYKRLGDRSFEKIDSMEEKIDGDTAVLHLPRDPDPAHAIHARRIDGRWKLRLADAGGGVEKHGTGPTDYQEPEMTFEMVRVGSQMYRRLAKEIDDGKYKSADEVDAALTERGKEIEKDLQRFKKKEP